MKKIVIQSRTVFTLALVAGTFLVLGMQEPTSKPIQSLNRKQAEILSFLSLVYLDDGQGGTAKTIRISGANLQVRTSSGTPSGASRGNLIIGYNELGNPQGDDRTGRGHLVVGSRLSYPDNNFYGYGSIVAGLEHTRTGGTVVGGRRNRATGAHSSVTGGFANIASGNQASVSGGHGNTASGTAAAVSGGFENEASGEYSCVNGGWTCTASARDSTVCGGSHRSALGLYDWVAGALFEQN